MKKLTLSLVFYPQPDGGFTVLCPEINGCMTQGENYEDALKNAKEAIALMLEDDEDYRDDDFARGLAMPNKIYTEIEVEVDNS